MGHVPGHRNAPYIARREPGERGIRTHEDYVRNTLTLDITPRSSSDKSHLPIVIHHDPEHAMTDGAQSITPATFAQTMKKLRAVAEAVDREV